MNRVSLIAVAIAAVVALVVVFSTVFRVDQTEQAIVLQFGRAVRVIQEPGLNFKLPFVQNVVVFDKRILSLDPPERVVNLKDRKQLIVDAYVRYRIVDPLTFLGKAGSEALFNNRIGANVSSNIGSVLTEYTMADVLSKQRDDIMLEVLKQVNEGTKDFGVEVVDLRIGRTELPVEARPSVYQRMRSDFEQQAKLARSEGEADKKTIQADADLEVTKIDAAARSDAQKLQGQGEGERNRVLGRAYGQDLSFFDFYRSLQAYQSTFSGGGDTTLIISPDGDFFRFFKSGKR